MHQTNFPGKQICSQDELRIMGYIFYTSYSDMPTVFEREEIYSLKDDNNRLKQFLSMEKYYVLWEYKKRVKLCTHSQLQQIISNIQTKSYDITIVGQDFENSDMLHFTHDDKISFSKKIDVAGKSWTGR